MFSVGVSTECVTLELEGCHDLDKVLRKCQNMYGNATLLFLSKNYHSYRSFDLRDLKAFCKQGFYRGDLVVFCT